MAKVDQIPSEPSIRVHYLHVFNMATGSALELKERFGSGACKSQLRTMGGSAGQASIAMQSYAESVVYINQRCERENAADTKRDNTTLGWDGGKSFCHCRIRRYNSGWVCATISHQVNGKGFVPCVTCYRNRAVKCALNYV